MALRAPGGVPGGRSGGRTWSGPRSQVRGRGPVPARGAGRGGQADVILILKCRRARTRAVAKKRGHSSPYPAAARISHAAWGLPSDQATAARRKARTRAR